METIIRQLTEYINLDSKKNIFIQGGYFESDSGVNTFSENTAELAIKLANQLQKINSEHTITIGVLINDLGMKCDESACNINNNNNINKSVSEQTINFLKNYPEFIENVNTEKHMRNKGLKKIKKILKRNLDKNNTFYSVKNNCHKNWYHKSELNNDILLCNEKEDTWIAKCPLIMGAYYLSCILKIDSIKDSIIIDFCSFNDKDKVLKGAEVALKGFQLGEDIKSNSISIFPILVNDDCTNKIVMNISTDDLL
ncbi:MAG: hypothetical protein HRT40_02825 [Campylobacteraceae bacterium]|nr:hypothetical protein [Campylobacteraceae bacterium]